MKKYTITFLDKRYQTIKWLGKVLGLSMMQVVLKAIDQLYFETKNKNSIHQMK